MGDPQSRIAWSDAINLTRDPTQARRNFIFASPLRHQLHAYTDAEERATSSAYGLIQGLNHPAERIEPPPTVGECPDPRQDDAIRLADCVWIAGHGNRLCVLAGARGAFECFR